VTNLTHNFFCVFISILYKFRATSCSSSGESIVSIQHLVYVTLCRWPESRNSYNLRRKFWDLKLMVIFINNRYIVTRFPRFFRNETAQWIHLRNTKAAVFRDRTSGLRKSKNDSATLTRYAATWNNPFKTNMQLASLSQNTKYLQTYLI
jgi:hypothetical protein